MFCKAAYALLHVMRDIRFHGNLVYLVPIFMKFHTLIVIYNRYMIFLLNSSNRLLNVMRLSFMPL